jgi:tRNA(Ile2) C34 agmatinyltransferase TiaS
MLCLHCGKKFRAAGSKKYCCAECKKAAAKERSRIKAQKKKGITALDQIAAAALAEGLSYGQYVAKYKL